MVCVGMAFYLLIFGIAPSSDAFGASFPPKGKPTLLRYVGIITTVVFYISLPGIVNAFPWGGRWAGGTTGRMRASVGGSAALVIASPAQGGYGIPLPADITKSPPHQSPSVPASPRGEAYVLCYVGVIATVFFYNKPYRFCQSPSPGGKVGRRNAGSDEGER